MKMASLLPCFEKNKPGGQNHTLYSGSRTDVVDVVTHVIDEEVTEVGEEGCH